MTLDISSLSVAIAAAAAAGLVGCFAIMRRMALAADALSHIALPGIGLALLLRIHPGLGAAAMLLVGTFIVWGIETKTRLGTEVVIGVLFSAALAVGSLITSGEELIEALFGGGSRLTTLETVLGLVVAGGISAFVVRERHRLVLALISPDIARTAGVDVARLNLRFLLVFALTIAIGVRYLGVLLIGSLVIVPAATAKRVARSLGGMLVASVGVAVLSTSLGIYASSKVQLAAGPLIVLAAAVIFFLSLLRSPRL